MSCLGSSDGLGFEKGSGVLGLYTVGYEPICKPCHIEIESSKENKMLELITLASIALLLVCIASFVHGLVLSFKSSIILGILCLFLAIPYSLIAVVYWISGVDLAERVVRALPEVFFI